MTEKKRVQGWCIHHIVLLWLFVLIDSKMGYDAVVELLYGVHFKIKETNLIKNKKVMQENGEWNEDFLDNPDSVLKEILELPNGLVVKYDGSTEANWVEEDILIGVELKVLYDRRGGGGKPWFHFNTKEMKKDVIKKCPNYKQQLGALPGKLGIENVSPGFSTLCIISY
jgi:hypothetical protein